MLFFTHEVFRRLANQIQGQICVMLEFCVYHGFGGVIPIPTWQVFNFYKYNLLFTFLWQNLIVCRDSHNER